MKDTGWMEVGVERQWMMDEVLEGEHSSFVSIYYIKEI